MDHRPAAADDATRLGRFTRDLATCLAVHRDRSPAVVWPDGADAVLARLPASRRDPRHAARVPADAPAAGTEALVRRLGGLLGCRVDSSYLRLRPGVPHTDDSTAADTVLLPVRGGCHARLRPPAAGARRPVLERPLELRLLRGEALYVPRGVGYVVREAHAPSTVLVLALRPRTW